MKIYVIRVIIACLMISISQPAFTIDDKNNSNKVTPVPVAKMI